MHLFMRWLFSYFREMSQLKAQRIAGGTNMAWGNAWGNAVLSEGENNVEFYEREYPAGMLAGATGDSTFPALLPTVVSRGRQAKKGQGVNDGFEDIVGASRSLSEVFNLV